MSPLSETRLEVSRIIQAERKKVFEAWIRPELMKKWFCPQELVVAEVKADARVGGKYLIAMKDETRDKIFTTFGTYKEIIPNQKLVFTWEWEEPDRAESLVTVTFKDKKGSTEVTVLHERFVDMPEEKGHKEGWTSALENLAQHIETRDREIVISRVFDAPRERVFEAMTDPKQVVQWWGPNGFTTTIHEMDVKPGGVWRHTMHGPDGTDYPNKSIFLEVVKPERIIYQHAGGIKERGGACFKGTWTFEDQGGKTKLTLRLTFASSEERDHTVKEYEAIEGGKQTLARLASHLAGKFVLSRLVDAPRERVWEAWTQAEQLKFWFGPKGFETFHARLDFRPGGVYHYGMRGPNGIEMWGKWTFREIVRPERLMFVSAFSDKDGGLGRHPLAPSWPQQFLSTILFQDFGGKTLITITWEPFEATEAEAKTFREGFASMTQGWNGTFERLDAYLKGESSS